LSEANKEERLRFAFQQINNVNFWENVVFSDDNPTRKFLTNQIAAFFKFGPIKLIYNDNPTRKFLTNQIAAFFKFGPIKLIYSDNPTRTFLTNQIAAFFKFGPIKLIYSEKCMSK
jgi:hypothetical protein